MWEPVENGKTIGQKGSENGIILSDEEYKNSCRITLEKCNRWHAITCGIYGLMFHTAFCGEHDCESMYEAMKTDLQEFLEKQTDENEEILFCESFVNKY